MELTNAHPSDDARLAASKLARHSMWAGAGFSAVIVVAVLLELLSRGLVLMNAIGKNSVLDWAIHIGEYALLAIDVLLLIGIVGKLGWRLFKAV